MFSNPFLKTTSLIIALIPTQEIPFNVSSISSSSKSSGNFKLKEKYVFLNNSSAYSP